MHRQVRLDPAETSLIGSVRVVNGEVLRDPVYERIEQLVDEYLVRIGRNRAGDAVLFCDPGDRRLWVLTYPQFEYHGGGPPRLDQVTREEATRRFGEITAFEAN